MNSIIKIINVRSSSSQEYFKMKKERGAQVTIYIIIAVILIAIVVLFFLFRGGIIPSPFGGQGESNPNEYLRGCLEDRVNEVVVELSHQGGSLNPTLYKNFKFEEESRAYKISYLCYNVNSYLPCVNQQPNLVGHFEEELKKELGDQASSCLTKLENSFKSNGYNVNGKGSGELGITIAEDKIMLEFDKEYTLTKTEETKNLKKINTFVESEIGNLLNVAIESINREVLTCDFDYISYMKLYPKFKIEKQITTDGTEIYTITEREKEDWFRFAVRGCVIPPTY